MTTGKASRALGVTPEGVREMTRRGELEPVTVSPGGWRYYDPEAVRRLAEERVAAEERAARAAERRALFEIARSEMNAMLRALSDYREWIAADLPGDLLDAHVALAAVRLSHALGVSFDMSDPHEWERLAERAQLEREDTHLLVEIGEQMAERAASAA